MDDAELVALLDQIENNMDNIMVRTEIDGRPGQWTTVSLTELSAPEELRLVFDWIRRRCREESGRG
jgi:hypothetical protein